MNGLFRVGAESFHKSIFSGAFAAGLLLGALSDYSQKFNDLGSDTDQKHIDSDLNLDSKFHEQFNFAFSGASNPPIASTHNKPSQLYSFGRSSQGQLGLGGVGILGTPTLVDATDEEDIVHIDAGGYQSAVVTRSGDLLTWGCAPISIGHNTREAENIPRVIDDLSDIAKVSCGKKHIVCLDTHGQIFTTGSGYTGRLINDGTDQMTFTPVDMTKFQHDIPEGDPHPKAIDVAAGTYQTLVLFDNGTLFEAGKKVTKRRLDWTLQSSEPAPLPRKIPINEPIVDISAGCGSSAAVTEKGNLYLWGDNSYGTIGNGRKEDVYVEKCHLIRKLRNKVKKVEIGDFHVLALLNNGEVYSWGRDRYSECGFGQRNSDQLTPKQIHGLEAIGDIGAGSCHSIAISEDGSDVFVWGRGDNGALGIGVFSMIIARPHKLELFIGGTSRGSLAIDDQTSELISVPYKVQKAACGTEHTLLLAEVSNPLYNETHNL